MIPIAVLALSLASTPVAQDHGIPHTKFVLHNGLQVIVHEDHTNPIVSVCVVYHVGSAREEHGKTGLAHVFEHMMFRGSQHVGDGEHAKFVKEAGGQYQAYTSLDATEYYENLPSNELELALWLESDRMGFLLPTLDRRKLDNVIDVVRNERRERIDGYAEGIAAEQIMELLYPPDHPYSWVTCGSHDDLATVDISDVRAFAERWYGPNNATLVVGGDVDVGRVSELVQKYFGAIPVRPEQGSRIPPGVRLQDTSRFVKECDVRVSKLRCVWPVPSIESDEEAALRVLVWILDHRLKKVLRTAGGMAQDADVHLDLDELCGRISIEIEAQPTEGLTPLYAELGRQLESLETEIDSSLIERARNQLRTYCLLDVDSVSDRTRALAYDNAIFGRPDRRRDELRNLDDVGPEDVRAALRAYLLGRPHLVLSLVPEGHPYLCVRPEASNIPHQADSGSAPDRTKPAPASEPPTVLIPAIWHTKLDNGLNVVGITRPQSGLCSISLTLPLGAGYEPVEHLGMLSVVAAAAFSKMLGPHGAEWTDRWHQIGSTGNMSSGRGLSFTTTLPTQHLADAVSMLSDMVIDPDLSAEDLELAKRMMGGKLYENPRFSPASNSPMLLHLLHGSGNFQGANARERTEALQRLTLTDVRDYLHSHVIPSGSTIEFVGPLDAKEMALALAPLAERWRSDLPEPTCTFPRMHRAPTCIHLCNRAGAVQSEIEIAQSTIPPDDPNFCALWTGVSILGSPDINSRLNKRLREVLGYTYHCDATIARERDMAVFLLHSMVDTDHTPVALQEIISILRNARVDLTEQELESAKSASRLSEVMRFETISECMGELLRLHRMGLPDDATRQWLQSIDDLKLADVQATMRRAIDPDHLLIVVTGDAAKIREGLRNMGMGEVVEIDGFGNAIPQPPKDPPPPETNPLFPRKQ